MLPVQFDLPVELALFREAAGDLLNLALFGLDGKMPSDLVAHGFPRPRCQRDVAADDLVVERGEIERDRKWGTLVGGRLPREIKERLDDPMAGIRIAGALVGGGEADAVGVGELEQDGKRDRLPARLCKVSRKECTELSRRLRRLTVINA